MGYTQADIDELRAQIRKAATLKRFKHADGEYEFRELKEMKELLSEMEASVNGPKNRLASFSKGA